MIRSILAVALGFIAIVALALLTDVILMSVTPDSFTHSGATRNVPLLVLALVYTSMFMVVGGYVTALVAKGAEIKHAIALGVCQLLMSAVASVQYSETAPVWWHVAALTLIIPSVLLGGYIRAGQNRVHKPVDV